LSIGAPHNALGEGLRALQPALQPALPPALQPERRRQLLALAQRVRRLQAARRGTQQRCPTGLAKLDDALGGGFALGCVHELLAPNQEAPARSLALLAAAQTVVYPGQTADGNAEIPTTDPLKTRSPAARSAAPPRPAPYTPAPARPPTRVFYIDTTGDFYPPGAAQLGLPLDRLLVIRTLRTADALWVCEQALRCQAIAAVVLPIRSIDAYVSRRLQLAAEKGGGLGFLLRSEPRGGHTFAATRLRLDPLPNKDPIPQCVGDGVLDSLVPTCRLRITLLKLRDGRPTEPFELFLPLAPPWPANRPPISADPPTAPACSAASAS
jgi:hypothetical protein